MAFITIEEQGVNSIDTPTRRVLSIQSHVVSGYVGNKSATFPLQVLGYDVDALNSVHFSNHTGYPSWEGDRLTGDQLWDLVKGLEVNDLLEYTHVLTGYIGSVSVLENVIKVVTLLKERNPNLVYVCDPVMGDSSGFYVPKDLLPLFRDELAPLATILTPNHFEAEVLTGIKIKTNEDAIRAQKVLLDKGIKHVVITSCRLETNSTQIWIYGGSMEGGQVTNHFRIPVNNLPGVFTGTGDLFSALILAWMDKCNGRLDNACEKVLSTMQAVLQRTLAYRNQRVNEAGKLAIKHSELRLIQSKTDIETPPDFLFVVERL